MVAEMYDTAEMILHAAKAEIFRAERGQPDPPGSSIHEHGTCRMGADPKRSALNAFNQMHEVKNLFVVDGSAFTSASEKNPTLTILALEIFSPKAIWIFLLLGFVYTWAGGAALAQKGDAQGNAAGDISGTYTGTVNYPSSGLTGDATLTIANDKFTLTSGSAVFTGTIGTVR